MRNSRWQITFFMVFLCKFQFPKWTCAYAGIFPVHLTPSPRKLAAASAAYPQPEKRGGGISRKLCQSKHVLRTKCIKYWYSLFYGPLYDDKRFPSAASALALTLSLRRQFASDSARGGGVQPSLHAKQCQSNLSVKLDEFVRRKRNEGCLMN